MNATHAKALLYEELSLNAHPALQTQLYDGWALRFANGYTKRANSIHPLYPSALDLHEKIEHCERQYGGHGLPAIYKLTDGTDPRIGKALDEHGYAIVEPTFVMEASLRDKDFPMHDCVVADHADDEWLSAYYALNNTTDGVKMATARQILENVKSTLLCGRSANGGGTVACGTAVIERGYMALQNVIVDEAQRGKGYGRAICESLLAKAKQFGAHTAYLQVTQANHVAVGLYRKLGYEPAYTYWYREQARTGTEERT